MRISRPAFVAAAASAYATIGVPRYVGAQAEFVYKLNTDKEPKHPIAVQLAAAAERIKQQSGGRMEIRIFYNGALGGQAEMNAQIRSGSVEFVSAADVVFASVVPVVGITSLPFIFSDRKQALNLLEGPLGPYISSAIAKAGVYSFGHSWDQGFRQVVTGTRPVLVPGDLKGLKLRTPESPVMTALFAAFGATPTSISANEMYAAMQTHLVDGSELPLTSVEVFQIYEVQKYIAYTNHIWAGCTILANGDSWQRLPPNIRDIVTRNLEIGRRQSNIALAQLETTLETKLTSQGMTFTHPDISAFQAVVRNAGLYKQWKASYPPEAWAYLEQSVGKLT